MAPRRRSRATANGREATVAAVSSNRNIGSTRYGMNSTLITFTLTRSSTDIHGARVTGLTRAFIAGRAGASIPSIGHAPGSKWP